MLAIGALRRRRSESGFGAGPGISITPNLTYWELVQVFFHLMRGAASFGRWRTPVGIRCEAID